MEVGRAELEVGRAELEVEGRGGAQLPCDIIDILWSIA